MAVDGLLKCGVVLLLVSYYHAVQCGDKGDKVESCNTAAGERIQLDIPERNETCGFVEGRVQFCMENEWKHLCDSDWTQQDAKVMCRSLNYSVIGVVGVLGRQQPLNRTTPGVICNGDEQDFSECLRDNSDMCQHATAVKCFLTDQDATQENDCGVNPSTSPPPDPRNTTPTGIHTTPSDPTMSESSSSSPHTDSISADTTATVDTAEATDTTTTASISPYLIAVIVLVPVSALLLVTTLLLIYMYCHRYKTRNRTEVPGDRAEPGTPLQPPEPLYNSIESINHTDTNTQAVHGNLPNQNERSHAVLPTRDGYGCVPNSSYAIVPIDYGCSANPSYAVFPSQWECDIPNNIEDRESPEYY